MEESKKSTSTDLGEHESSEDGLISGQKSPATWHSTTFFTSLFSNTFMRGKQYNALLVDDDAGASHSTDALIRVVQAQRVSIRRWRLATVFVVVVNLVFYAFFLFPLAKMHNSEPPFTDYDDRMTCGNTTTTALSRDCQYHPLSHGWLHRDCDVTLARESVTSASNGQPTCQFWLDKAGTKEVTGAGWDALERGTVVWTTQSHHVTHCVYLLAQAAAAMTMGGMMEENARKWEHQQLCVETIMSAVSRSPGWNKIKGFVHVGSGACW